MTTVSEVLAALPPQIEASSFECVGGTVVLCIPSGQRFGKAAGLAALRAAGVAEPSRVMTENTGHEVCQTFVWRADGEAGR